ncbi:TlpA family protein disulfide reductase [Geodermatophilus sp. FMUSA9-8]|uniref:TlpA family protein disulfide reductase n=1 Tax=Geodermatophilus sp. FMUSA9-8 TaxID=3120155 RepID=UPI003008B8DE
MTPGPTRRALLTVATAAAFSVLVGCSAGGGDRTTPGAQYEFTGATPTATVLDAAARAPAPTFDGELLDGSRFESSSLTGDIAVINFWGSWCAPCRVETPEFQAVYADVADQGVQFLSIDVKDQRQLAIAFVDSVDATYPSLFDPRGEVALAFRGFPANVVPSTILLDRAGRVAAVCTGAVRGDDLRTAIDLLLMEGT